MYIRYVWGSIGLQLSKSATALTFCHSYHSSFAEIIKLRFRFSHSSRHGQVDIKTKQMSSKSWTTHKVNTQNERENAAVKSYSMCVSVCVCAWCCALTNPNNLSTIYGIKLKIRRVDQRRTEPIPAWKWSMAQTKTPGKCFVWLFFGSLYCCCCYWWCCCCRCCRCLPLILAGHPADTVRDSQRSFGINQIPCAGCVRVCQRVCVCVCACVVFGLC